MLRAFTKLSLTALLITLNLGWIWLPSKALAEPNHLIINEVQISGGPGLTTKDFIEIFNPSETDVDLEGYRLVKRTATASSDTTIKSWTSSTIVPAHGFYLWANTSFTDIAATPDTTTSQTISDDNGIALRQGAADTGTIIDSLAWGEVNNGLGEGALPNNPEPNQSLERKTTSPGHRQDTHDNLQDFENAVPSPQNSSTTPEIQAAPPTSGNGGGSSILLTPSSPQPGEIVINEFVSDPVDGGQEWIELYNRTSRFIDLAGFVLMDGSGAITQITGGLGADPASRFLTVYEPKGNLNNEGDTIILKYNGQVIDQISYGTWDDGALGDNAPKPEDPLACGRLPDGLDSNNDQTDFRITQPTPSYANQPPAQTTELDKTQDTIEWTSISLNEIYPNPVGADSEGEFIELTNLSQQSVDLNGWFLSDGTTKYTLKQADGLTTIAPQSYLLLPRSRTKIALNNSGGETIQLLSPAEGVISTASYQDSAPEGASWSRDLNGNWYWSTTVTAGQINQITQINRSPNLAAEVPTSGWIGQNILFDASDSSDQDGDALLFSWDFGDNTTSTLTSPTHTYLSAGNYKIKLTVRDQASNEVTKSYSLKINTSADNEVATNNTNNIILSEIMPNPEGSDDAEWLELQNTGAEPTSIFGLTLTIGSRNYVLPDISIEPKEFAVVNKSDLPFTLTNTGGTAKLINSNNEVISQTTWESASEGLSWAWLVNNWAWTEIPTPGEDNIIDSLADQSDSAEYLPVELAEAKYLDHGEKITVEGVVAAPRGLFTATSLFLAGSGLQISASGTGWPDLKVGEKIRLQGSISKSSSGTKLLVRTPKRLTRLGQGEQPQPHLISIPELNEEHEAWLITTSGTITKVNKTSFNLTEDNITIKIHLKNQEQSWTKLTIDTNVTVTGFVVMTNNEPTLWLRSPADITVNQVVPAVAGASTEAVDLSKPATNTSNTYWLLASLMTLIVAGWWWQKKKLPQLGQLIKKWVKR